MEFIHFNTLSHNIKNGRRPRKFGLLACTIYFDCCWVIFIWRIHVVILINHQLKTHGSQTVGAIVLDVMGPGFAFHADKNTTIGSFKMHGNQRTQITLGIFVRVVVHSSFFSGKFRPNSGRIRAVKFRPVFRPIFRTGEFFARTKFSRTKFWPNFARFWDEIKSFFSA
jgi:hypothetical protein